MLTMTQLEALRTTLAAWNAANMRARREYARRPIAACMGVRRVDGEAIPCDAMAVDDHLCRRCASERKAAARRMRNARVAQ